VQRLGNLRAFTARTFGASQWLIDKERRWILLLAFGCAGVATFLQIGVNVADHHGMLALDLEILRGMAARRQPFWTVHAIDITALGSLTLLSLASTIAGVSLLRMGDHRGVAQLVVSMGGVAVWTYVVKNLFTRARPDLVYRLIEVPGYSFPSGHSSGSSALYLTLALVFAPHLHHMSSRAILFSSCAFLSLIIGISRVYLGVHYPSDVVSGLTFGGGWAFLVAAVFAWRRTLQVDPDTASGELDNLERK